MAHLRQQFKDALGNIEPSNADKSNAPKAHQQVPQATSCMAASLE